MFVSQISGPFGGSSALAAFTNNGLARNQIVIQERHNAPTVDVEGGGGMVQRVPWNIPGFGADAATPAGMSTYAKIVIGVGVTAVLAGAGWFLLRKPHHAGFGRARNYRRRRAA